MGIKKFIYRFLLFCIIAFPVLTYNSLYAYYTRSYEFTVNGTEVYVSINKSNMRKKVKALIIGDSVGKQLYDNDTYNGDIFSLASNRAMSIAGYYILLKNFINHNQGQLPQSVYLLLTPSSFLNNLDQIFTFHYFLKPFYKSQNQAYFTPVCIQQIKKVPLYFTSQLPFVVNTNWSPEYHADKDTSYHIISPISHDYLIKISQLCDSNHIQLNILGTPVKMVYKKQTLAYAHYANEFKSCGLQNQLTSYFNHIQFMPDSVFFDDIHFKKEHIPKDYFKLESKADE